jgi:membrane-associated protease RseP (regulator of RpoE activity)
MEFIPDFGGLAFTLLAFIAALSIIVAIHEYGHYIVGRWSGIHAEVFSVGFGPVLFSRTDRHGTKWQIAALPFGGYVKFLGDADAASGKDGAAIDALDVEERRRSMHGAPLWARSATVAAGPIFNFILSILIFASVLMIAGRPADSPSSARPPRCPPTWPRWRRGISSPPSTARPSKRWPMSSPSRGNCRLPIPWFTGWNATGRRSRRGVLPASAHRAVGLPAIGRDGCGPGGRRPDPRGGRHAVHAFSQLREAVDASAGTRRLR